MGLGWFVDWMFLSWGNMKLKMMMLGFVFKSWDVLVYIWFSVGVYGI